MTKFKKVNPKQSFPKLEEEIINFWEENDTFKKSIENRTKAEEFNFYDGPPFATGKPHYGHILAGTIKDVIPRYQTMKGKKVERKFGWDTHGLPIENIVEKKLNISGKEDIEENIGIYKFNETCRENVFGYVDDWKKTVKRMGRWVDMENDYKTMDTNFMESVWWVYKNIYDKGLIYEGNRIVPYCPRCSTPLSNFEVNQGYKDKQDKAVTVKFKVKDSKDKYILAWTTTPWTLYANLGLAVGKDIMYSEILDKSSGETYVLASKLIKNYYKNEDDYTFIREYPGTCLVGIKYEPLFDDFEIQLKDMGADLGTGVTLGKNSFSVVLGHHVTIESGTGIVHIAPAFGEDDNIIGKKEDLGFVIHINDAGKIYNLLDENKNGQFVFDFNEKVLQELKEKKVSIHIGTINHSYPHCWRCGTPLIYRAISAWYVDVTAIKEKIIANNQKINWVPEEIKDGRMGKWLEGARDWNISRNRYWGSAIPVWQNEDKSEEVCIGSIEEMYELNKDFGQIEKKDNKYFYTNTLVEVDIHKHFVDEILLKNPKNFKAKKVLGIHGFKRDPKKLIDFFKITKQNLEKDGIIMDAPTFEEGTSIDYKNWEKKLDELNLSNYDTVVTHSMGGRVAMEYILEKKVKLDRLVMVSSTKNGSGRKEVTDFFSVMKHTNLSKLNEYVKEIVFLISKDDTVIRLEGARLLAKELNTKIIEVDSFGHFNVTENKIIESLIKYGTPLKRIPEVLDCWFESGSMPYASKHFMGEEFKTDEKGNIISLDGKFKFPADFIAEGLDQTRGWFYTLLILGTALFDNTPFFNCIVNGIILAEDGKKMSKSLQNYPAPELIFDKYGADAMRFYLLNSPVVEAEDFRFAESGVEEVVKKVILPLWNTYYFFTTYANIDNFRPKGLPNVLNNNLDKWLISELNELTKKVTTGFDEYRLNYATKPIVNFMNNLTNWYIRRSRKRFWKSENDNDKFEAYETLYFTLVELSKIIAPFMPFISEYIYKNMTGNESVHLENFPIYNKNLIDEKLNTDTEKIQKIITLGLSWRVNQKLRVRQPLQSITITEDFEDYYKEILKEELNVKKVLVVNGENLAKQICKPNGRNIGPKFGKDVKFIMTEAKKGNFEELKDGNVKVGNFELEKGDFELVFESENSDKLIETGFGMVISMDEKITPELKQEGITRDIVRHIQEARKEADYNVEDRIFVELKTNNPELNKSISNFGKYIETETLSSLKENLENSDFEKEIEIKGEKIIIKLKK